MQQSPRPVTADAVADCGVLVVGSGVAGLRAALAARAAGADVLLVTAGAAPVSGCTDWAQGGMAVALGADDSPDLHLEDTLAAGRGLCDREAVRVLVEEAPGAVLELVAEGLPVDRDPGGGIALGREAAHSRARIVHAGGDATGHVLAAFLSERLAAAGVRVLTGLGLRELLCDAQSAVAGAAFATTTGEGRGLLVRARATVLASGGAARLWPRTTNPAGATGAGIAAAYDAGAEVASLEMVQFHPTALAVPGAPALLVSEAVRGEGAHVVDGRGRRFLLDADPRGELAGRDTVAAAIVAELQRSGAPAVFLDARHVPGVAARFPTVSASLAPYGLDLGSDLVPIAPAAHYTIGGVVTDSDGVTTVPGLFAAGEVAATGVHGANRLASNSLLEGLVFGRRAGAAAADAAAGRTAARPVDLPAPAAVPAPAASLDEVGAALAAGAGIVRDEAALRAAAATLDSVASQAAATHPPQPTLRAAARTASLICHCALLRTESRGAHRRSDHPHPDPGQEGAWVLHRDRSPRCDRNARSHR